jgi:DNA primase
MRVEDIKARYSMRDILGRCGIQTDRHGFCKCCFHDGDNTASMKVYEKDFYCFGCGKGGDLIRFVMLYHNLRFKEACEWISGEKLSGSAKEQLALMRIKRKEAEKKKKRLREELNNVNKEFTGLWQKVLNSEPLSDEWTSAYNKWQLLCYKQEQIIAELGVI